jgi:hypothetical protein
MTAKAVLHNLSLAGCRVTLSGEQLRVAGTLTNELRGLIREHKSELVEHLKQQAFVQNLCQQMDATGVASFLSVRLNEPVHIIRSWDSLPALPEGALAFSLRELLAAHRQSLDPPATLEEALRIFPGSKVVAATIPAGGCG